jgi:PAS domain S-box-containing protein
MTAIAPSILIVEDEPAHAEAIRRAFQDAGAAGEIQVVGSLREYREAVAARPPDIALVDLNLPDGSAMDVLFSPPEAGPFPILVMTSYGDEHVAVEAMKAGALDYIAKSAETFADMPRAVQRALDQWELLLRSRWTEEELRQSEQTLQHTVAELETIHANVPVAMMLVDRQRRVTKVSGAAARLAGRTEQEMLGLCSGAAIRCLNALDDPRGCGAGPSCDSCPIRMAVLDTFATGQEHRQIEAWLPLPAGDKAEDRCLLVSTALLKLDETQRVLLCVLDITERKRAEKESQRLAEIADRAPVSITVHDFEGRFLYANQRTLDLHGYNSKEEFMAVNLRQLDTPESAALIAVRMQKLREAGEAVFEVTHLGKDGAVLPLEVTASLMQWGGREVALSMATDLAYRKKSETRVATYQRRLRTLGSKLALAEEHERRRIAADLHDDVAQALSLAKIKLQSLRAAHPDTAPAAMQELEELVGHAVLNTRSLLFDLSPPPLYELGLEAAVEWLAEKTQTEHKLAVAVEDDRQAKPLGEEIRGILFRAVRELLHNTVKHAHARKVGITIRREDPFIRVEVADDGAGVNLEKDRPPREVSGGFGLFHIRERLDYVGGRMEIHSGLGCGTRVVLLAPLQKETPKTQADNAT